MPPLLLRDMGPAADRALTWGRSDAELQRIAFLLHVRPELQILNVWSVSGREVPTNRLLATRILV
jgi:hypothetical protein